jgi:hypothetical protein
MLFQTLYPLNAGDYHNEKISKGLGFCSTTPSSA